MLRKITILIFLLLLMLSQSFSQNGGRRWGLSSNLTNLNSIRDDFAPHFNLNQDILYFNSDRGGKSHFYYVVPNPNNAFSEVKILKSLINPIESNQSYISCPTGNEAYFSAYRNSDKQSYLNIYKSIFNKNNWTEPTVIDSLMIDAFCSHVSVSPDGNVMVFASTRHGLSNDIDLWMSYRNDNGNWSSPIAINELNSQGNEITPFLHSSDTLYFSSNGYEGPGAYDIYMSTRSSNNMWNRPKPLFDFNTEFNESDFTILPDSKAIFASDRPGGLGKLDLYVSLPVISNNEKSEDKKVDLTIRTQISNIIAEQKSIISRYPSFHFFVSQSYELSLNNYKYTIDSLLFEYPNLITQFLLDNPNEILVIDSTIFNQKIISFFSSKGISSERLIFQKNSTKQQIIKCKLLSGKLLPIIELGNNQYNYKPPVVEVSIESREDITVANHSMALVTNKSKHDIEINDYKLPIRDIISLDEFDSEVFESDSIIINYKISSEKQIIADAKRVLFVSHQKIKESRIIDNGNYKFEQYFLILPDNNILGSDYFSTTYWSLIKSNLSVSKSVKIVYYNEAMKFQANKLRDLVLSFWKGRKIDVVLEMETYKENSTFSQDISTILINIQLIKP